MAGVGGWGEGRETWATNYNENEKLPQFSVEGFNTSFFFFLSLSLTHCVLYMGHEICRAKFTRMMIPREPRIDAGRKMLTKYRLGVG